MNKNILFDRDLLSLVINDFTCKDLHGLYLTCKTINQMIKECKKKLCITVAYGKTSFNVSYLVQTIYDQRHNFCIKAHLQNRDQERMLSEEINLLPTTLEKVYFSVYCSHNISMDAICNVPFSDEHFRNVQNLHSKSNSETGILTELVTSKYTLPYVQEHIKCFIELFRLYFELTDDEKDISYHLLTSLIDEIPDADIKTILSMNQKKLIPQSYARMTTPRLLEIMLDVGYRLQPGITHVPLVATEIMNKLYNNCDKDTSQIMVCPRGNTDTKNLRDYVTLVITDYRNRKDKNPIFITSDALIGEVMCEKEYSLDMVNEFLRISHGNFPPDQNYRLRKELVPFVACTSTKKIIDWLKKDMISRRDLVLEIYLSSNVSKLMKLISENLITRKQCYNISIIHTVVNITYHFPKNIVLMVKLLHMLKFSEKKITYVIDRAAQKLDRCLASQLCKQLQTFNCHRYITASLINQLQK